MARKPSTRLIRKAQRALLEPMIAEWGFTGKYPEFRRELGDEVHFIWFGTRKYGGGFSIHGGWAPGGDFKHWDDRIIPADEVEFAHTDFDNRAEIERVLPLCTMDQRVMMQSVGDFEYGHIVEHEEICFDLVAEAAAVLPQLENWLRTREPDFAVSFKGHRLRGGISDRFSHHLFTSKWQDQFDLSNRPIDWPRAEVERAEREAGTVDYEA